MTQKTKAALLAELSTFYPNNSTGDISAADVRDQQTNIIDSFLNFLTDAPIVTTAASVTSSNGQTIVCTNTIDITITLHTLVAGDTVNIIRAGTGGVSIDGNGAAIIGNATQSLPSRYDVANLLATITEWVLSK